MKNEYSNKNIDCEIKRQKAIETKLVVSLLELTLTKKTLIFSELSIKYLGFLIISNNGNLLCLL